MTILEAKDQVADDYGYKSWRWCLENSDEMLDPIDVMSDEAAELYAEAKAKEAWNAAIDAAAEAAEVVYDEDMAEWFVENQSILKLKKSQA